MEVLYGRSKKVKVRESGTHGLGWFADDDIKKGELVFCPYPPGDEKKFDHSLEEILKWDSNKRRKFFKIAYQVDDDVYNGYHSDTECSEDQKLDWHLNHSCDPNVWYIRKDLIEARRDIQKGQELTYDYATTQANTKMAMPCNCGSKDCRKIIKGDDWKIKELQEKYGLHWLPYILQKIQLSNKQ